MLDMQGSFTLFHSWIYSASVHEISRPKSIQGVGSGFLPGFLWQVRIKAKVAEFTHSPRKL